MLIRILIVLFVVASALQGAFAQQAASPAPREKAERVPGVLYVKFAKNVQVSLDALQSHATGVVEVDDLLDRFGVYEVHAFDQSAKDDATSRRNGIDRMYVLYYGQENDALGVARAFDQLRSVESVSPRYIFKPCFTPNDPRWNEQWALKSNRMNLETAWNSEKGNARTIIAILDGGVNYTHEDLEQNLYIDSGEVGTDKDGNDKKSNGKDDDGDGYKDNWRGWDLAGKVPKGQVAKPDNDPMPDTSTRDHGTLVAGAAAARANNGKGIAGAGFNCSYMPVKTGNAQELYMGYEGIQYASRHGAKAIVCAWGGEIDEDYVEFANNLIVNATELGSLVVASSGNAGIDIDLSPFYPAAFPLVLGVGATQENDKAAGFSNFGKVVDVFAPGANIISTDLPDLDSYDVVGGTSFSAPLTAGVVGLVATKYPEWTPQLIARQIVETCDNVVNPSNRTKFWGRVNAYRALTEPTYPGLIITGFSIDSVESGLLNYINKPYTLDVKFKNVVSPGTVSVVLLNIENYNVSQASAPLGSVGTGVVKNGRFIFSRDPNEYVEPGADIRLAFYATDGNKYKDTLYLNVTVGDDLEWQQGIVSDDNSSNTSVAVWPNPAASAASLRFSLTSSEYVQVSVVDMLGRVVYTIPQSLFSEGTHEVECDVRALPVGPYVFIVESQRGERITKRFLVAH